MMSAMTDGRGRVDLFKLYCVVRFNEDITSTTSVHAVNTQVIFKLPCYDSGDKTTDAAVVNIMYA